MSPYPFPIDPTATRPPRRNLGAGPEVQPPAADATESLTAGGSLPLPYVYRIDVPAPHRPEGMFMMAYGHWDTAPGPITTVEHAAIYAVAQARVSHSYFGAMTIRLWASRGDDEHYRNEPPDTAYVLELPDVADKINPTTKAAVEQLHQDGGTEPWL